jgi:NAD(P)-dependent dehydrogenase (short-subunit alcohol dehydrogenase family)
MPNVIITGADRGLGLALCREFLARGWTVFGGKFLKDYNLLEQERGKNPALNIIPLNVGDKASIEKARDLIKEQTDSIDMIINNAAVLMEEVKCSIDDLPMDLQTLWDSFRVKALGPAHMVEYFLPLMDKSSMKRLCFISSEVSCISLMKYRDGNSYPYCMSKSSMTMGVRLMHNLLYPQGYTFRLYHPGWMKRQMPDGTFDEKAQLYPAGTAAHAAKYFEIQLGDEHRLVMYDYLDQEWPF